jgi:hypothetical protein
MSTFGKNPYASEIPYPDSPFALNSLNVAPKAGSNYDEFTFSTPLSYAFPVSKVMNVTKVYV